jgi:hypothetical protein
LKTDTESLAAQVAECEAEASKAKTKFEDLYRRCDAARRRYDKLAKQLRTLKRKQTALTLVGVAGGAKVRYRVRAGHKDEWMNDAACTLVKVNRTRVLVDFGDRGKWDFPLEDIIPVTADQDFRLDIPF